MYRILFDIKKNSRIVEERLRSWLFRIYGSKIAGKCLFGRRVRIDNPWRISVGFRTQIEADVWIKIVTNKAKVTIGDFSFIGRGVEIDVSEEVSIGNHVLIAPGVFITDHSHNIEENKLIFSQGCKFSAVIIEDDVWLGVKSVVLPGVLIGRGAVIGAGAIVTHNVPKNAIVAGVPAKILRYRNVSANEK